MIYTYSFSFRAEAQRFSALLRMALLCGALGLGSSAASAQQSNLPGVSQASETASSLRDRKPGMDLTMGEGLMVLAARDGGLSSLPPGRSEQGKEVAAQACAVCHGEGGQGKRPAYPRLSGQKLSYLTRQVDDFVTGRRRHAEMTTIVDQLSDQQLADAVAWYASQAPETVARPEFGALTGLHAPHPEMLALGKRLFEQGDHVKSLPRCADCHGAVPVQPGLQRHVPNLEAQPADYLSRQLQDFSSGRRKGMVMKRIAPRLSPLEIYAITAYLERAALPVLPAGHPVSE